MLEGALFLFGQPAALLVLVLLVLGLRDAGLGCAAAAAALAAGGALAWLWIDLVLPPWVMSAWVAAAALALAAGWQPKRAAAVAFGAPCGLALGLAAGIPTAGGIEALGTVGAALLLAGLAWAAWRRAADALPVVVRRHGPRIGSAWLTAIAALLLALQVGGR